MSQSLRVFLQECLAKLTDARRGMVVYPLVNVVTIAICAVLCGADDFVSIAEFGRAPVVVHAMGRQPAAQTLTAASTISRRKRKRFSTGPP